MQIRKLVLQQNHLQYTDGFAHPSGVMVSLRTRQVEDESILPCNLVTQDQFSKLQENSSLTVTASSFQFLAAALCSLAEYVDRVMSPISPPLLLITAARSPVSVALGMLRRSAAGPIYFRISLGIVGLTVGRFGVNAAVWHSSPELLLEGEVVSSSSRLEGLPLSSPPPHSQ